MPCGPVAPGLRGLLGLVGVGPDLHPPDLVGPAQDALELGLVLEPGRDRRQRPQEHLAGRAVEADLVALAERDAVRGRGLGAVVDEQLVAAGHARLADLAGHDGGVRGRPAAGGQDALRHGHPVEVVRRGLDAHEHDPLAPPDPLDGDVGVEHGPPDRGARRGVEALGDPRGRRPGGGIELVAQQLVDVGGLDAHQRLVAADDALVDEVGGDLDRGRGGPLRRARLEHVQLAALDRELEVLDVAVMALELLPDPPELGVDLGHVGRHLGDLRGGPDAGHDVLALGVGQVLAEEGLLAGIRVPRERDARPGIVAHVAEDHRHDVDRRAQVVGDLLVVAVVDGALAEPAREHGLDGQLELLVRVARELAAGVLADDGLEVAGQRLQVGRGQVGVLRRAVGRLRRLEGVVEALALHVHDDAPEHLDEAAVRVPAEALVAGEGHQAVERLLVQAQVQDRVHHAGHRELGPRADADEERVGGVPEALAGLGLDLLDRFEHVVPEAVGQPLAGREVVVAGLGRDREAGRDRQPGLGHLGQPSALAAEEVAHVGVALGVSATPGVDVALGGAVRTLAGGDGGVGHRAISSASARPPGPLRRVGRERVIVASPPCESGLRVGSGTGACRASDRGPEPRSQWFVSRSTDDVDRVNVDRSGDAQGRTREAPMNPKHYESLGAQHYQSLRTEAAGGQRLARERDVRLATTRGSLRLDPRRWLQGLAGLPALRRLDVTRPGRDLGPARRPELRQDVLHVAAGGLGRDAK